MRKNNRLLGVLSFFKQALNETYDFFINITENTGNIVFEVCADRNRGQTGTACKCVVSDVTDTFGDFKHRQRGAIRKGFFFDFSNGGGNGNLRETATTGECRPSDFLNRIGNGNACETAVTTECRPSDFLNRIRNDNAGETATAMECPISNFSN